MASAPGKKKTARNKAGRRGPTPPVLKSGNRIVFPPKLGWAASVQARRFFSGAADDKPRGNWVLDFSQTEIAYPDGIIPVIAEASRLLSRGLGFEVIPPSDEIAKSVFIKSGWLHYIDPKSWPAPQTEGYSSLPLRKFSTDEELNSIVSKVVEICIQQLVLATGVAQALEWSLNEIADNVLTHSGVGEGWIQAVTYKDQHRLTLVVCDTGIGIPASMRKTFDVKSDKHALSMAIKKGVTSNPEHGQGNGLAGVLAIAQNSGSNFAITSGKGRVSVKQERVDIDGHSPQYHGTFVYMQFFTDRDVDLPKALGGHTPVNHFELKFEDEKGNLHFKLSEYASSFGNRVTGERIRNLVLNLLRQNPGQAVRISMEDVGVVSSSFADELFGKLFVELGPLDFSTFIRVEGVNPVCKSIIDHSVSQRIAQTTTGITPVGSGRA